MKFRGKEFTYIAIFLVFVLAAAGAYFYFVFSRNNSAPPPAEPSEPRGFAPLDPSASPKAGENAPDNSEEGGFFAAPVPERLRKLSGAPSSGATFGRRNGEEVVRFVDRATGHIFEAKATSTAVRRVTNTTVPRVEEAVWLSEDRVAYRYLRGESDIVETFLAEIDIANSSSTESALRGEFLPENIISISPDSAGGSIFYILKGPRGAEGFVRTPSGAERLVFSHPLSEWNAVWERETTIALETKPSAFSTGHFFTLNAQNGSLSPVFGGRRGLSVNMSPDARRALYSLSLNDSLSLFLFSFDDGAVARMPVTTLPEKCAWSEKEPGIAYCGAPETLSGELPDRWYQGAVSFTDAIVRLDTVSPEVAEVVPSREFGSGGADIVSIAINEEETRLVFLNKKDGAVWLYEL